MVLPQRRYRAYKLLKQRTILAVRRIQAQASEIKSAARSLRLADAKRASCACIIFGLCRAGPYISFWPKVRI